MSLARLFSTDNIPRIGGGHDGPPQAPRTPRNHQQPGLRQRNRSSRQEEEFRPADLEAQQVPPRPLPTLNSLRNTQYWINLSAAIYLFITAWSLGFNANTLPVMCKYVWVAQVLHMLYSAAVGTLSALWLSHMPHEGFDETRWAVGCTAVSMAVGVLLGLGWFSIPTICSSVGIVYNEDGAPVQLCPTVTVWFPVPTEILTELPAATTKAIADVVSLAGRMIRA